MKSEQLKLFLNRIQYSIQRGEYDIQLTLPFLTRELIYASIKAMSTKKEEAKTNPILTDFEISKAIEHAKETAATTFKIFLDNGLIEKTEDGYQVSELGNKSISYSRKKYKHV